MKRKVFAVILLAFALGCGAAARSTKKAADPERADSFAYMVKDYNGRVAVFQNGKEQPNEILDCPLDSLPQEEIQRLKEGIPASDEEELQRLIEAFD